ncbi:MAG: FtsW/RodA/SpoVE family cell cycle protein, partial [Gammaproteobacteria bacterium]|nr:FtsW/RodA/SpoVE family cell cycle protein [Gammaproteobacteria bacterium]
MNYTPRQLGDLTPTNPNRRQGLLAVFHIDLPLLVGLLLLCGFGLIVLYSASGENLAQVERQAARLLIAFLVMLAIAQVSPSTLRRWSPSLYAVGMLMLVAVLIFGEVGKGAQRWLDLGIVRFQPSELVKLAVPLMIAWYLAEKRLPPSWQRLLIAAV